MIEVKLLFKSVDDAIVALDKLRPEKAKETAVKVEKEAPKAAPVAEETPEPKRGRGRPRKPVVIDAVPAATEAPKEEPKAEAPKGPAATEEDVRRALEEVWTAHGESPARDLLSRYGARRLRDVAPESRDAFVEHAKRVIAGEPV